MDHAFKGPNSPSRFSQVRSNQLGFSLVGTMVASAIVGIIGYFLSDMIVNAHKSNRMVNARYSQTELISSITQVLGNRTYCKTAMNRNNDVVKLITGPTEFTVDKIIQVVGAQETLVAETGKTSDGGLHLDSMKLEYKKDASGNPIAVQVDKPSAGQSTHHLNFLISTSQIPGNKLDDNNPEKDRFHFKTKSLPITVVANSVTGDVIDCQTANDFVGEGAVIWSRTISTPNFPLTIQIPEGVKGLKMDLTVFQVIQLPPDKGRTAGSRFNYSTNGGASGTYAVSEIGGGNNNGGQARYYGTTSGVIPINDGDTEVTITRQGYLLNENGSPVSGQGMFQAHTVTFFGLDKAPESPPPPPPPMGPVGGGGGGGGSGGGGWDDFCFVAGTKIQMADGSLKTIENISVGDSVVSYDESNQQLIARTVTTLHRHSSRIEKIHDFKMADGSVLSPNGIHPIYVVEKGAYFQAQQIAAMMEVGARVSFLRADGAAVQVAQVSVREENVPLYNFEVDGINRFSKTHGYFGQGHNYYAEGYLVHNAIYGSPLAKILQLSILGVPSYAAKMAN